MDERRPSRDVLDELVAERIKYPKVQQKELAKRLGISGGQLSSFESGDTALPHEMGVPAYRSALADLKRVKRQGAAA